MAMSGRETNTMDEYLQKMLRLITDAKIAPDSDLGFLVELETTILQYIKAPAEAAGATAAQTGVDAGIGMEAGMMAGAEAMGGMPPGMGVPSPPTGVNGLRTRPTINADELRRMVQG